MRQRDRFLKEAVQQSNIIDIFDSGYEVSEPDGHTVPSQLNSRKQPDGQENQKSIEPSSDFWQ